MRTRSAAAGASHHASNIQQLRQVPLRRLLRVTVREARSDDLGGLAAEIAYHTLFALPPTIICLAALAATVNTLTDIPVSPQLRTIVYRSAPVETRLLLSEFIDAAVTRVDAGVASIGLVLASLVAIWSWSNAVMAMDKAFNRAFDVRETRSMLRQRLLAIGLTLLMLAMVVGAFVLFIFGRQLGDWLAERIGWGETFTAVWSVLSWPLAVSLVALFLSVLYYVGPDIEQSFRWITPGSLIATLFWLAAIGGFKVYLWIADPGIAYGAFSSVILLLMLLYLTGLAFLFGAEVNAVIERRYDPATIRELVAHPERLDRPEDIAEARQHARAYAQREGRR